MLYLRQAIKELLRDPRFALLFVFNLGLGLSGLVTMEAFRSSLQSSLRESSLALLAADLSVATRRPFTAEEKSAIEKAAVAAESRSSLIETFSMVRGKTGSRLALLKGLGASYPLRGSLELEKAGVVADTTPLLGQGRAWMDAELARQLGLGIGDTFRVGTATLKLTDLVRVDPTQSFRGLTLAGRILLSNADLAGTGLLRAESTVSYVELFRFAGQPDLAAVSRQWAPLFADPAVRVRAAGDAAEDSGRLLSYLGDFLGLSALVALFLSSLGAAYLFRTWLVRRSRALALHQVLGLNFRQAAFIPALQAFLLALAAVPLSALLAQGQLVLLASLIDSLSPVALRPILSVSSLLAAFCVAAVGAFLLSLPLLLSLRSVQPRELLSGHLPEPKLGIKGALLYVPALLLLYALAVTAAQSYRTAALFVGALAFATLALLAAGFLFLRVLSFAASRGERWPWPVRQGVLYLSRRGLNSLAAFMALALGALLLNLLPQLRATLGAEIESPDRGRLPSLFLFDIQEEQLAPLEAKLGAMELKLENLSPLVRARLLTVNGQPFERGEAAEGFRTREEENESRFRNRGFNLTYRAGLNPSETLVTGTVFEGSEPQISLETRFADRLGLKIGDDLVFDVQGVEVGGKVRNTRSVRWTTFQPNFFVLFNEGVLEGAPKMHLGSLRELTPERKDEVQNTLAESFPNVSVVDIKATVDRALDLADRMRWSLNLMSGIALFAGLVVLFSIAHRQAELRRWDMNLCRVLGGSSEGVRAQTLVEFGLLGGAASAFGALLSLLFAWITAYFLFDGTFVAAGLPLAATIVGGTLLTLAVAWLGAGSLWRRNPAELLQE